MFTTCLHSDAKVTKSAKVNTGRVNDLLDSYEPFSFIWKESFVEGLDHFEVNV